MRYEIETINNLLTDDYLFDDGIMRIIGSESCIEFNSLFPPEGNGHVENK